MTQIRIGLLLFPRMTQLDLTGPFEVFANVPGAQVLLLWKTLQPVEAETGLRMLPHATLHDCPPLDVICVPGGPGVGALMEDAEVLAWLRAQAEICTVRQFGVHRIVGARRGWIVARPARDLALGVTRSAGGVRGDSDRGARGARRQSVHRRRRHRGD